MLPTLTGDILFFAFIFAALAFVGLVVYSYYANEKNSKQMTELQQEVVSLRGELKIASKDLGLAETGRKLLISRIDRLIMRRDDLLTCLNAAQTDEDKVACILRLMGAEEKDGSVGA